MRVRVLLALVAASPALALAQSQPAPRAPTTDWSIETVVVTAGEPGPAFWHIKKGNSEVFILGTLEPIPGDLKWDTGQLGRIMQGARAVLLPPRGRVGLFEGVWFLITEGDVLRLPDGQKLEQVLPPPLKQRFVAARNASHADEERYARDKPSVAGFRMEQDFIKARGLALTEPNARIEALATARSVPARNIANYPALDVIKEVPTLSMDGNLKCLKDSLDDIDVMAVHARPAAQAWAQGDLAGIKAHYSDPKALDCLGQSATFNKLWAKSVSDTVAAVNDALDRNGKSVAVINIGELLRKGGVIERLKAQGFTVEGPGE
jgi:uncharacterized protein YbaP (TraB family)